MKISIIICTHNPRKDYFKRVIEALRRQSLPFDSWELLLVDNGSHMILKDHWDLSWHPNARHIREDELGLTPARLRGIREARGDQLVFVDDDNVLDSSYLETALKIADDKPWIGAFGGSSIGEFELEPAHDTRFMMSHLAIREIPSEVYFYRKGVEAINYAPWGAGMVISSKVADYYQHIVKTNPLRKMLDRTGSSLMSAGDTDMALCACELGMGVGLFPSLRLIHLIPRSRIEKKYLLRLTESISYSNTTLRFIWSEQRALPLKSGILSPYKLAIKQAFYQSMMRIFKGRNFRWCHKMAWTKGRDAAIANLIESSNTFNNDTGLLSGKGDSSE